MDLDLLCYEDFSYGRIGIAAQALGIASELMN